MTTTLTVKVKPNAGRRALYQDDEGGWHALLKAPPVDGRANAELVSLIARHFRCRKADVSIRRGGSGRTKTVRISDGDTG